eukprot:2683722-Prymnesium_polylepis.1
MGDQIATYNASSLVHRVVDCLDTNDATRCSVCHNFLDRFFVACAPPLQVGVNLYKPHIVCFECRADSDKLRGPNGTCKLCHVEGTYTRDSLLKYCGRTLMEPREIPQVTKLLSDLADVKRDFAIGSEVDDVRHR